MGMGTNEGSQKVSLLEVAHIENCEFANLIYRKLPTSFTFYCLRYDLHVYSTVIFPKSLFCKMDQIYSSVLGKSSWCGYFPV